MNIKKLKIKPISLFSHELKTPLSSLKLALYLLEKNSKSKKDKKLINLMNEEVDQMTDFICNHLDLQILEDKKDLIELKWQTWNKVLSKALKTFQLIAQEKNVNLKVNSDIEFEALIDSTWLSQALRNFLSNAIKFSPRHSTVSIDYELTNTGFSCSVTNQGGNLSEENIENLFHKSKKSKNTHQFFLRDTGFGLQIAKMIIENHNGSLSVHSNKDKKEITFSFSIPNARLIKKSA